MLRVLVAGHTGDVGEVVVRQLLASPCVATVLCVGRREAPGLTTAPGYDKLVQASVDSSKLPASGGGRSCRETVHRVQAV
jgi:hypothetical protein